MAFITHRALSWFRAKPLVSRITIAFVLFGSAIIIAIASLSIWANEEIESIVLNDSMNIEAERFSVLLESSGESTLTRGPTTAWLQKPGVNDSIPAAIAALETGTHDDVHFENIMGDITIREVPDGRLILFIDDTLVDQSEQEFLYMLVAFSVLFLILSAIIGRAIAVQLTKPLNRLQHNLENLDPAKMQTPLSYDNVAPEIALITDTINGYQRRVGAFVERERSITSMISHELRNPLAVISGAADVLLRRHDDSSEDWLALKRIKNNTRSMADNIDALLMLARESVVPDKDEVASVEEISQRVISNCEGLLVGKKVHLTSHVEEGLQLQVTSAWLSMVISNLLRNAIRHTDSGSISLEIGAASLTVTDSGSGIATEDLQHITHAKARGVNARGSGYGLGLYIVEQICERLGWRLNIESNEGVGTVVKIIF